MFRNTVVSLSQFLSQNCIIWITSPTTTVVVEILPRIITWLHYAAIFLAIFWPLTDPLIILFCKPVYILENKLSVCLSVWSHLIIYWLYSMSMTLLDHWPIKILDLVPSLCNKLSFYIIAITKNSEWIKIIFMTIFFISVEW